MEVVEVKLRDEYIKLGQALKAAHVVGSGVDAKFPYQPIILFLSENFHRWLHPLHEAFSHAAAPPARSPLLFRPE